MQRIWYFLLFLLILLLILSLAGCRSENVSSIKNNKNGNDISSRIRLVYSGNTEGDNAPMRIYVDSETKVMYLYMGFTGYKGGFSIMEDAEGKPLLWED